MSIFDFFDRHWFLAFLALYFTAVLIEKVISLVYRLTVRLPVLLAKGYPPEHCDVDGDFRPLPKVEEASE